MLQKSNTASHGSCLLCFAFLISCLADLKAFSALPLDLGSAELDGCCLICTSVSKLQLRCNLWSIVANYFVWKSMSHKILFQLADHYCQQDGGQSVDFKEITELVYGDQVLFIADRWLEEVHFFLRLRVVWSRKRHESFFLLKWFVCSARVKFWDIRSLNSDFVEGQ